MQLELRRLESVLGSVYKEIGLPWLASGLPYTDTFPPFFSLRRIYKAARVTWVGGLPYLRARITLVGGLTFSLVNTPGRVARLPGLTF